jgi:hypothetical protein
MSWITGDPSRLAYLLGKNISIHFDCCMQLKLIEGHNSDYIYLLNVIFYGLQNRGLSPTKYKYQPAKFFVIFDFNHRL